MLISLAVDVHERLRVSSVSKVDLGQDARVTITFEVIKKPPVLLEGVGGEQIALDRICAVVQPDRGITQRRPP